MKMACRGTTTQKLLSFVVFVLLLTAGIHFHRKGLEYGLDKSRKMFVKQLHKSKNELKVTQNITFPHGSTVRGDVLDARWVQELRKKLLKFTSIQINFVASDGKFQSILLNWLIAALVNCDPPLENVMVLSLDKHLHSMMVKRNIPSIYVSYKSVIERDAEMQTKHSKIWITRTTVYRLVSSWGYDLAVFDTDAIVVKNPKELFDNHKDRDIIGSAGKYPFMLGDKWGITFCMGVALFRHTPRTEMLWEALSTTRNFSLDDQVKLNYALDECSIQWSAGAVATETVLGECEEDKLGGLRVAIISYSEICRQSPCVSPYYILHRNSRKENTAKMMVAKDHGKWFLRDDWGDVDSSSNAILTGTKWLQAISVIWF